MINYYNEFVFNEMVFSVDMVRIHFLVTRAIYYSEYESAEKNVLPMRTRGLSNDFNRALIEEHRAVYGEVKELYFVTNIKKLKYDTRHFHEVVFGFSAREWKKQQSQLLKKIREENKRAEKETLAFFKKHKKTFLQKIGFKKKDS